jgi:hypothetical protein
VGSCRFLLVDLEVLTGLQAQKGFQLSCVVRCFWMTRIYVHGCAKGRQGLLVVVGLIKSHAQIIQGSCGGRWCMVAPRLPQCGVQLWIGDMKLRQCQVGAESVNEHAYY